MSIGAVAMRDATPVTMQVAGWMILSIGNLRLALQQRDVQLIEVAADLERTTRYTAREHSSSHYSLPVSGGASASADIGGDMYAAIQDFRATPGDAIQALPAAHADDAMLPNVELPEIPRQDAACEVGWLLRRDEAPWPVYSLDEELRLQRSLPASQHVCVFVAVGGTVTGIACDRLQLVVTDAELAVENMPGCMTGVASPITGFARRDKGLIAVTSAAALVGYLAFLQEQRDDTHE